MHHRKLGRSVYGLYALCLALASSGDILAASITLKKGGKIRGVILENNTGSHVRIQTKNGVKTIIWDQIAEIEEGSGDQPMTQNLPQRSPQMIEQEKKSADRGFELSAFGGYNYSIATSEQASVIKSLNGSAGGFGAGADFWWGKDWQFGFGGTYLTSFSYDYKIASTTFSYAQSYLPIMGQIRFMSTNRVFFVGAGAGYILAKTETKSSTTDTRNGGSFGLEGILGLNLGPLYADPVLGAYLDVTIFVKIYYPTETGSNLQVFSGVGLAMGRDFEKRRRDAEF